MVRYGFCTCIQDQHKKSQGHWKSVVEARRFSVVHAAVARGQSAGQERIRNQASSAVGFHSPQASLSFAKS